MLRQHAAQLKSFELPTVKRVAGRTRTSGTTGQPVVVLQSRRSLSQFVWMKQRELRWFRVDPTASMLSIRSASELPRPQGAERAPDNEVLETSSWPLVGRMVRTGRSFGRTNSSAVQRQRDCLLEIKPAFLLMNAACLEHLALACSETPPQGLAACLAISQTLSQPMRNTVERSLAVVHQNYGLNEVGLVASRCPAGGRYHVHAEQALMEIIDADGKPSLPGERGKLLVTSLVNEAMPLIRYDTGDLAVALDGPCPCGRTLPSFGEVLGRYVRITGLPSGTWQRWGAIQRAFSELPAALAGLVSRYQVHQLTEAHWQLRLQVRGDVGETVANAIRSQFDTAIGEQAPRLEVVPWDDVPLSRGEKFQAFTSALMLNASKTAEAESSSYRD